MLWQEISAGTLPTPNSNTLYFVYLPLGTQGTSGGSASCSEFCGYRETVNGFYYALMPYLDCTDCQGGIAKLDAITSTSSRELCEGTNDPEPSQG